MIWSHHEKYLTLFSHEEYHYLYEIDLATFYLLILVLERIDALYKNIWSSRIY